MEATRLLEGLKSSFQSLWENLGGYLLKQESFPFFVVLQRESQQKIRQIQLQLRRLQYQACQLADECEQVLKAKKCVLNYDYVITVPHEDVVNIIKEVIGHYIASLNKEDYFDPFVYWCSDSGLSQVVREANVDFLFEQPTQNKNDWRYCYTFLFKGEEAYHFYDHIWAGFCNKPEKEGCIPLLGYEEMLSFLSLKKTDWYDVLEKNKLSYKREPQPLDSMDSSRQCEASMLEGMHLQKLQQNEYLLVSERFAVTLNYKAVLDLLEQLGQDEMILPDGSIQLTLSNPQLSLWINLKTLRVLQHEAAQLLPSEALGS